MLVDEKFNVIRQSVLVAQKANCTLGCIPSSVGSTSREGILSLCSAKTPLGVLHPGALEPSAQDRHGPVWSRARGSHKNDPGVHQEECGQQDKGGSPSPLHYPGEASSGVLCPVLGSPVQEG